MENIYYLNYQHYNPELAGMLKTNLPLNKLTSYLAGLMLIHKKSVPKHLAKLVPNSRAINNKTNCKLFDFASHVFNNDTSCEPVPINDELKFYQTGVYKSIAKFEGHHVYIIDLTQINKTHQGTNNRVFVKKVKFAKKREEAKFKPLRKYL